MSTKKQRKKELAKFRRRLSKHYKGVPKFDGGSIARDGSAKSPRRSVTKLGAASEVRALDGDELAVRKAELEARGLPPTKAKVVAPKYRGKTFVSVKSQTFFPSNREARRGKV